MSTSSTISGSYNLYVGAAPTLSNSVTYYSNSTVTGTSTAFSSSVIIPVPAADVPKTAKVTRVLLKSQTAGITLSKIHSWRTRRTGTSAWYNSGIFVNQIDIMNLPLAGNWDFSFQSASGTISFIPGLQFSYDYEIGD